MCPARRRRPSCSAARLNSHPGALFDLVLLDPPGLSGSSSPNARSDSPNRYASAASIRSQMNRKTAARHSCRSASFAQICAGRSGAFFRLLLRRPCLFSRPPVRTPQMDVDALLEQSLQLCSGHRQPQSVDHCHRSFAMPSELVRPRTSRAYAHKPRTTMTSSARVDQQARSATRTGAAVAFPSTACFCRMATFIVTRLPHTRDSS